MERCADFPNIELWLFSACLREQQFITELPAGSDVGWQFKLPPRNRSSGTSIEMDMGMPVSMLALQYGFAVKIKAARSDGGPEMGWEA
ncbi:MAG: hypothetical protein HYR56_09260 [Acidobacteria bacterium]|nr:hypothetical protein [Acidobacteriota bacterium]MBI3426368.1 hypothetical protein [Acidobacteriota bacterium]